MTAQLAVGTPTPRTAATGIEPSVAPEAPAKVWIRRGTADYRRAGGALFLAGFASFSLIYCVQPLLPAFAGSYAISAIESSLALSLTTGLLAFSIVIAGACSQALGRRGLMFASMALAALLTVLAAVAPSWHVLLAARALTGIVLGGVPAVAMAYLAEEVDPEHLGRTMGLYIGGTAFGGMMGRVGMGLLTEIASWQVALGVLGALCLAAAIGFRLLLPPSRNFVSQPLFDPRFHLAAWAAHLRNPGLLRLYAIGFVLTGIFVTLFNYVTFRLSAPPYGLGQTAVSMVFLTYALGMVSSSAAGALADRLGRQPLLVLGFLSMLLGVLLTLSGSLAAIVAGIAVVTTGFFVGHAVTSGSVGRLAAGAKGHAASLYLLFYYLGSSVVGSAGGWFWQHGGWSAVALLTGGLALLGTLLAATALRPRA